MENGKRFTIMMKDMEVMKVDFEALQYEVIQEKYLPYPIKGKLCAMPQLDGTVSAGAVTQLMVAARKNEEAVVSWLANRVLPLSRANAKWIYNLCHFEQVGTDEQKVKIALACRAVSVLDPYWLKYEEDGEITWNQVDVRQNPLNEIVAQVALHGKSLTLQGSLVTPELTTNGAYAKAWRRHGDSGLWLYKLGADGNTESRKAILTGMEFISYCNVNGMDPDREMFEIDSDSIYKMWIVDFLISNRDRHGQNWGFFYDTETMEILGCHPLFDHNNAFDIELMRDMDAPYQFGEMTLKQAARTAMEKVDFHFTQPIAREDFITERQYKSFRQKAGYLGLEMQ